MRAGARCACTGLSILAAGLRPQFWRTRGLRGGTKLRGRENEGQLFTKGKIIDPGSKDLLSPLPIAVRIRVGAIGPKPTDEPADPVCALDGV